MKFPPRSFNLASALHHACGGVSFVHETPCGLRAPPYPQVTHDQILDIEMLLYDELLRYAVENPRELDAVTRGLAGDVFSQRAWRLAGSGVTEWSKQSKSTSTSCASCDVAVRKSGSFAKLFRSPLLHALLQFSEFLRRAIAVSQKRLLDIEREELGKDQKIFVAIAVPVQWFDSRTPKHER
jgi:hypothetical protein